MGACRDGVHRGVKVYRGSAGATRTDVESDRSRVDDYYLAEGTGLAQRHVAVSAAGEAPGRGRRGVHPGGDMDGDTYEAWVAGREAATGVAKGRLRTGGQAVRFVEVVMNCRRHRNAAGRDPGPDAGSAPHAAPRGCCRPPARDPSSRYSRPRTAEDQGEHPNSSPAQHRRRRDGAHLAAFPPGDDGFVFTLDDGQPITRQAFGRVWRPAAASAGLATGTGMHALRHYYASLLIPCASG